MDKTCRLVHITYRENNRGPGREEYKFNYTRNYEFKYIFFTKFFLNRNISNTMYDIDLNLLCAFLIFFTREAGLRFSD